MLRRLIVAGLAALLTAPALLIEPASAAVLFSCSSVTGSAALSPGLVHDKRPQGLAAGPGATILASASDAGVNADFPSQLGPAMSPDGTKVAFLSQATNLDPADTDTFQDVYVKDLTTGDVVVASTTGAGVKGNQSSDGQLAFSGDGNKLAFVSSATNLSPADSDPIRDVYVKDLISGDIVLASTSDTGVKANRDSLGVSLSGDGARVAFATGADSLDPADPPNPDDESRADVYVKDLTTGDLVLASTSDAGVKGNAHSRQPSLSADGTIVAFDSYATNLDPADTDSLVQDVYVKNLSSGDITLASTSDTGVKGDALSGRPSLSASGTEIAFDSWAHNLDPAHTIGYGVYVKDLTTGDLVLASTSDAGVNGNAAQGLVSLAADGTTLAFESESTNLDPGDTDTLADVYVKDLTTGDLVLVSTSDAGTKGNGDHYQPSLAGNGSSVAFTSIATNLDPADGDTTPDTYVKRLPSLPTSFEISGCSNGQTGTAAIVDIHSFPPRPLGCPTSLGGAAGNDYPDTTAILVGANPSLEIDWASGPNSYGVAAAKAGPTGTQWRFRLTITAGPGHDTPATNQYLPAPGSGSTKTRLQGRLDVGALDSFDCSGGTADPIDRVALLNNGSWVAKNG
jgi:Tol biopolymer transport system component